MRGRSGHSQAGHTGAGLSSKGWRKLLEKTLHIQPFTYLRYRVKFHSSCFLLIRTCEPAPPGCEHGLGVTFHTHSEPAEKQIFPSPELLGYICHHMGVEQRAMRRLKALNVGGMPLRT